jgi:predicted dinucleotide-binding enzyme
MRIGIIGAGHVGGALTRQLTELGHEVSVANSRGPETLTGLAQETGSQATTVEEAVAHAQVVIVAVPLRAVRDLPAQVFAGKVVVDANNYYPARDGQIAELDAGTPSSRWVAQHLHGASVVKAFNNIQATHLLEGGEPAGEPGRIALPVAADDGSAKQTVLALVDALGFDPVDAGTLDDSWRQQPDTPVYGTDRDVEGVEQGLVAAG